MINRQNRKRTLLIEWRMHFRTFIFMEHIWNIKGKNKKPIWVTLPAENEGGKKRKKSSVWDWHFGVVWIRQLDLQWHGPIGVYPRTPPLYPWWQGLSASMMVTVRPHTICTILHEQSVHKCNITVRRLNHIYLQTRSWLERPFGNHPRCKCDYCTRNELKRRGTSHSRDNGGFRLLVLRCAKE